MLGTQTHLNHKTQVNLGSYYTPPQFVDIVYEMLAENVPDINDAVIIDTSCGYGSFMHTHYGKALLGFDVDPVAAKKASDSYPNANIHITNSLNDVNRQKFGLESTDKIIVVGNPPYNDATSIVRHSIKNKPSNLIDSELRTRDLGMSFMLSYNKIKADYVCILHPLSYLIKKANFNVLVQFTANYRLIDSLIISSHEFSDTSKGMAFPIIIALYKRSPIGMNYYDDIYCRTFQTKEGERFNLSHYSYIDKYIAKYPNKHKFNTKPMAMFYTLRDINALRRSRTFIDKDMSNAVYMSAETFPFYCYVDSFKRRIDKIPYYYGNCNIMIDIDEFNKTKPYFISDSINNNSVLQKQFTYQKFVNGNYVIDNYFEKLLAKGRA